MNAMERIGMYKAINYGSDGGCDHDQCDERSTWEWCSGGLRVSYCDAHAEAFAKAKLEELESGDRRGNTDSDGGDGSSGDDGGLELTKPTTIDDDGDDETAGLLSEINALPKNASNDDYFDLYLRIMAAARSTEEYWKRKDELFELILQARQNLVNEFRAALKKAAVNEQDIERMKEEGSRLKRLKGMAECVKDNKCLEKLGLKSSKQRADTQALRRPKFDPITPQHEHGGAQMDR